MAGSGQASNGAFHLSFLMLTRARSTVVIIIAILVLPINPLAARGHSHVHYGEGLSVDLKAPYARVVKVVNTVIDDGIVRGSSEYRGSSDLYGAVPQTKSDAFRKSAAPGTVFYKVRANTIAPDHFYGSNDVGTVTVRYVVQELGPSLTRVTLDAIFREDSGHRSHESDGTVEEAEFLAISDEIKDLEDQDAKAREDAKIAKQEAKIQDLQSQLDNENKLLKTSTAREKELQKQVTSIHIGKPGQVRTASADLKSQPYNESRTLQSLPQGANLVVLQRTHAWSLVQIADGKQGWIYNLMLQETP